MSRPNPVILFAFLAIVLGAMGGMALLKGGLFIGKHEADTLHLLQITFRMDAGEWPHLDFMTPIGALAYAPIVFFLGLGTGVGHAVLFAQIAMGIILLPAAWWVGLSRMRGVLPYLFGAVVIVLATALSFGLTDPVISISMHYNRWAWAIAFVAIPIALLPAFGRTRPAIDGAILGICMAMLVLIKVTYFVCFAPAIIVALVMRKSYWTLGTAMGVGVAIICIVTLFSGITFWQAYLGDLLQVAGSEVRPQPGETLKAIVGGPAYLAGTILALLGFVLLRQAGEKVGGVALLLLLPGFIYVTFQNFGNDPLWLAILAILMIELRPEAETVNRWGWGVRRALLMSGVAALALSAPSFINLASSPYRHLKLQPSFYEPILMQDGQHSDLQALTIRVRRVFANVPIDGSDSGLEHLTEQLNDDQVTLLLGEALPQCELKLGLPGWIASISQDLEQAGLTKGKRLFVADYFSSHWMYSDLEPLTHGAPWYYGGLPGFEYADYVLVPLCPAKERIRKLALDAISARPNTSLREIRRTQLYILLEIDR